MPFKKNITFIHDFNPKLHIKKFMVLHLCRHIEQ